MSKLSKILTALGVFVLFVVIVVVIVPHKIGTASGSARFDTGQGGVLLTGVNLTATNQVWSRIFTHRVWTGFAKSKPTRIPSAGSALAIRSNGPVGSKRSTFASLSDRSRGKGTDGYFVIQEDVFVFPRDARIAWIPFNEIVVDVDLELPFGDL